MQSQYYRQSSPIIFKRGSQNGNSKKCSNHQKADGTSFGGKARLVNPKKSTGARRISQDKRSVKKGSSKVIGKQTIDQLTGVRNGNIKRHFDTRRG